MTRNVIEPAAIIGMACRYASAPNLSAFWDLLVSGRDGVIDYPAGRTPELDSFYGSAGSELGAPSRRGGFLDHLDGFDADFFRISPREAELMDPQQRLLLELAWEALEDAGQALERIAGPRTGVFIGAWASDYGRQLDATQAVADVQSTVFNGLFAASSRLAFAFDFRGPELSVNGACASSLIAIHQAIAALRSGGCDVAFVGGVNAIVRPEISQALARAGVLSADGVCKFGDAGADGYVRGEGGGILVLKRLSQAVADGDRIRALVRGSAINNSGASGGFIKRPSEIAQSEVILAALSDAGLSPADLQYIEAHGTGTTTGDRIELGALAATIGRDRGQPCLIGSAKGNIGHTEAAAGVAAVIKTVLALEQRYIPPTLHVGVPNPGIDWESAGIALNTSGRPWPDGTTRRAGVSSFGIGGNNAHVVLEEAAPVRSALSPAQRNTWALPVSANSPEALTILASAYADALERRSDLADIAFTAATRRSALPYRLVAVGADAAELSSRLRTRSMQGPVALGDGPTAAEPTTGAVLVFSGQGSQWPGMGRELMAQEPVFRTAIARCDAAIQSEVGWSVQDLLMADTDWESTGIEKTQPALFSMQIALAALWSSWGVQPVVLVGHSMGEVAAAHVAGAISLEDATSIICRRSTLMTRLAGQGEMALVELSMAEAIAALHGFEDRLSVAVSNGPRSTVLSGEPQALRSVVERLRSVGVFCRPVAVQVAAHSPQMALIGDELLSALGGLKPRAGHTPIFSTTLGRFTDGAELDAQYWVDNLRQPVLFHTALKTLMAEGQRIFIEASPHPILLPAIDESGSEAGAEVLTLPSMRREEPEQETMLIGLGRLFVQGMEVDWSRLYPTGRVVDLPGHPWQRRRYWLDSAGATRVVVTAGGHPLLPPPFRAADRSWIWTTRLGLEILPWLKDHAVRGAPLLPATAYLEMATAAGRQIFGHEHVVVETLKLKEAIALSPSRDHVVQMVAAIERPGHWSVKFHVHEDAADTWTLAGSASIRPDDTLAAASLEPTQIETFERGKTAGAISGDVHAARLKRLGYDFGPDFQNLLWLDVEDNTVRAVARVNSALKTAAYALHPALLDAGLQALVAGILQRGSDEALLIPSSIGHARILPAAACARAAYISAELSPINRSDLSGDVRLYGADGALHAELREVEFRALGAARDASETSQLYRLDWVVTEGKTSAAGVPRTWLVVADRQGVGEAFASAMRLHGQTVEIVERAADPFGFRAGIRELGLTANMAAPARLGVVHFGSLDLLDDASSDRVAENAAEIAALATLISESGSANLWLVTRGACAAGLAGPVSVPQASVWGLGAVVANECPDLGCRMIDLARPGQPGEAMTLAVEVLCGDAEPRVALRARQRRVARLHPADATSGISCPLSDDERADLDVASPGVLDSLSVTRALRRGPSACEVEIVVHAAGLNFLDIIRAMGLFDPIANRNPKLGVECAGTVVRVGDGVTEFQVGDRVVALSPAFHEVGTLASHLVTPATLAAKIPDGLGLAEAAAIPCVYLTAYFALVEAARMRAGETVLIHSATGGVGLAAIQVARWIGAKIIASAGTETKRAMLRDLGIEGVFDSRATEFAKLVTDLTGGRGADVILNSLSGGAIPEGLAALAPYGRFLEIGKRDMWDNNRVGLGALLLNRSIFGIDLAAMIEDQPERVGAMLRTVMELVRDGVFAPLPITVFPASRAADAFQLMAAARHTGKVVIDTGAMEAVAEATAMPIRPNGAYLITGGLGALGLVAAEELVGTGARNLILCGRAAPSHRALQVIAGLRARGADVVIRSLDVGDEGQLRGLLDEVAATLPPLRGVIHAAGVLDDALVDQLSAGRFHAVMRGKADGARLLDRLSAGLTLDFFVLFSSVAALLGSPGQGNYSAANAMLDALAEDRVARGQPGLSIAWGPWAEIGLAAAQANRGARIAEQGLASLSPGDGRRLFRRLLGSGAPCVAAMHFDPASWLEVAAPATTPLFDDLLRDRSTSIAPSTAELCKGVDGVAAVKDLVMSQLAAVLRMPPDRLAGDRPFRSLGLDSLMGLELRNRLERVLGLKLSASTVWNFPTLNQLCAHLAAQIGGSNSSAAPAQPKQSVAQALEDELLEANALLIDP
jgi:acyl transferase domain-containing protein/acyl carrier protein